MNETPNLHVPIDRAREESNYNKVETQQQIGQKKRYNLHITQIKVQSKPGGHEKRGHIARVALRNMLNSRR